MKQQQQSNNKMFSIDYNGKMWNKKDCDDLFFAFYTDIYSLTNESSVYIANGDYVFPDGKISCDDDFFINNLPLPFII